MVTIRPISKTEVRCNKCNAIMGHLENLGFVPNKESDTQFTRFHIYDITDDGKPLTKKVFEVDLCQVCSPLFEKVMKKFNISKSVVQSSGEKTT